MFPDTSMCSMCNALATGPRLARVQVGTLNNGATLGRPANIDFYVSTWAEQPPNDEAQAAELGVDLIPDAVRAARGSNRMAAAAVAGRVPWASDTVAGIAHPDGDRGVAASHYSEALYLFPGTVPLSYALLPAARTRCVAVLSRLTRIPYGEQAAPARGR